MAFTAQQNTDIETAMEDFMAKRRPPIEIRDKVDLGWRVEGQSVVIFSIRPMWKDESKKIEEPAAKATFIGTKNRWKIYWMRADLKWHSYPPHPEAVFFDEFLSVVEEDKNCCFWG
jgi:Protein of unknown function (DUF3024)